MKVPAERAPRGKYASGVLECTENKFCVRNVGGVTNTDQKKRGVAKWMKDSGVFSSEG